MEQLRFDAVIHLAGEQLVPNYMAIKLSEANTHVLLTTTRTKPQFERLRSVFSDNLSIRHVEVPATNYSGVKACLSSIGELDGKRVGVNVTGGTKVMFAGVLDWCREKGYVPFYVDTQLRKIHFFGDCPVTIDLPPVFETVAEFCALAGYKINKSGERPETFLSIGRRILLKDFWKHRDRVRRNIGDFAKAADKRNMNKCCPPNEFYDAEEGLERLSKGPCPCLFERWRHEFLKDEDWRPAALFGGGGWFEEWLAMRFADSTRADRFIDLQRGLSLQFKNAEDGKDAQEIDLAYTDGYVLTLLECKAGRVFQEHIQKLENLRRQIGGAMGRGVLCAINYQEDDDIIVQRVKAGDISLVTGNALETLPEHEDGILPRRCYQDVLDYTP